MWCNLVDGPTYVYLLFLIGIIDNPDIGREIDTHFFNVLHATNWIQYQSVLNAIDTHPSEIITSTC